MSRPHDLHGPPPRGWPSSPAPDPIHATTPTTATHRILIVDDAPQVHDDFRRIFSATPRASAAELDDLEAELFGLDERNLPPAEAFVLARAMQCSEALTLTSRAQERGEPFDVAFVDMNMPPGPNGVETTGQLWKIDPLLQVVLCTAHRDFRWADVMKALGSTAHLHLLRKPFSPAQARHIAGVLAAKAARLRRAA